MSKWYCGFYTHILLLMFTLVKGYNVNIRIQNNKSAIITCKVLNKILANHQTCLCYYQTQLDRSSAYISPRRVPIYFLEYKILICLYDCLRTFL